MTLLELYEGLQSKQIAFCGGLCKYIRTHVSRSAAKEFNEIMSESYFRNEFYFGGGMLGLMINDSSQFDAERETFLLLFAAYKGEL